MLSFSPVNTVPLSFHPSLISRMGTLVLNAVLPTRESAGLVLVVVDVKTSGAVAPVAAHDRTPLPLFVRTVLAFPCDDGRVTV